MKAITIRELHAATGKWVRRAAALGEVHVTERGRVIAKLLPASPPPAKPFFANRKFTNAYRSARKFLVGGTDSTATVSAERDHAVA
jgi:antitoxin (DNA-binding transcriptional repressor) of toxin-antitoxin stability system